MTAFKCPRCGSSTEQRFYGPCADCVVELKQLKSPGPDPNFDPARRMDGSLAIAYVGPRVDREEGS